MSWRQFLNYLNTLVLFSVVAHKVFKWPVSVVLLDVSLLTCRLLKVSSTQLWPSRKFSVINKHHVRTMDSSTNWMKVMRSRFEALGAFTAPREKSETTQNFKTTQIKGASTTLSPGLTKKKIGSDTRLRRQTVSHFGYFNPNFKSSVSLAKGWLCLHVRTINW